MISGCLGTIPARSDEVHGASQPRDVFWHIVGCACEDAGRHRFAPAFAIHFVAGLHCGRVLYGGRVSPDVKRISRPARGSTILLASLSMNSNSPPSKSVPKLLRYRRAE